ncbi:MAG: folate family ECF transporter S component [Clostridia bacterium]|nr:folate family ECF transporter S component [Clostridia bacterium]
MNKKSKLKLFGSVKTLTVSAMLTAISVVIGIFCKTALNFDGGLFRITFENLPIILSGILFGPVIGGVVGLSSDLISYIFSSQVYPPNLLVTLGAIIVGVSSGIVSRYIIRKKGNVQIIASGTIAHVLGSMIIKPIGLYQFYGILVLWRIPLYLAIAPIEILILCLMLRRKNFALTVGYISEKPKMSYKDSIEYIHKINWCFCNPGLERIGELCKKLGNPQNKLKFIHVAGTNGKGSFCSMLASILKAQGYKVGLFTSPYVRTFNERMAINGEMISNDELSELTEKIQPIVDTMQDKPTEFELISAIAFEYFANNGCDYVVLECGLGGRLDSTNIIQSPALTVITGIALDHTSILGDTIEKIAFEKAGIIKKDTPCLWCGASKEAKDVIENRSRELGAPLYAVDHSRVEIKSLDLNGTTLDFKEHKNIFLPLLGEYQTFNVANVLTACEILNENGIEISEQSIKNGIASVVWHARFEIINKNPLIIADGGHNPEGVASAVKSVKLYFGEQKLNVITGVMADKDYRFIAEQIGSIGAEIFCITPNNPRALTAEKYAEIYKSNGIKAHAYQSIKDALASAIDSSREKNIPLICLGSLYMYCEICDALEEIANGQ